MAVLLRKEAAEQSDVEILKGTGGTVTWWQW